MPEKPKPSRLELAYRSMPMEVREDLLRFCGVWAPNLADNVIRIARNEGKRLVGLYILEMSGEIILPKKEAL